MSLPVKRLAWWLVLGAGIADFCWLAFIPTHILSLMGLSVPRTETLVWLRWVGAFVWAVGASYLWALLRGGEVRLRMLLELTIPFRLSAGVFSTVAIASGWLSMGWAGVPVIDFALVIVQIWILRHWVV